MLGSVSCVGLELEGSAARGLSEVRAVARTIPQRVAGPLRRCRTARTRCRPAWRGRAMQACAVREQARPRPISDAWSDIQRGHRQDRMHMSTVPPPAMLLRAQPAARDQGPMWGTGDPWPTGATASHPVGPLTNHRVPAGHSKPRRTLTTQHKQNQTVQTQGYLWNGSWERLHHWWLPCPVRTVHTHPQSGAQPLPHFNCPMVAGTGAWVHQLDG